MRKLNKNLFVTMVALLAIGFVSCRKEKIDTEKPTITIHAPHNQGHLLIGGKNGVHFDVEFADNVALKSYKVDIHNNFDGHSHQLPAVQRVQANNDSIAFSFMRAWNTIEGQKNAKVHQHEIKIPVEINGKPVKTGNYHFVVYCLDKAGNESFKAIDVKLSYHAEEHQH